MNRLFKLKAVPSVGPHLKTKCMPSSSAQEAGRSWVFHMAEPSDLSWVMHFPVLCSTLTLGSRAALKLSTAGALL